MFAILSAGLTIDFGREIEDERTLLAVLEESILQKIRRLLAITAFRPAK